MDLTDYGRGPAEVQAAATEQWTTAELGEQFEVLGFSAPFITCIRKSDGVKGSMEFGHSPRVYFNFIPNH